MNGNLFKSLILVALILSIGGGFSIGLAKAESGLILEVTQECNIQNAGNNCVTELKITNNTGKVLDGEAFLHIDYQDYQGVCSNNNELRNFDGVGIEAYYQESQDKNWLDFSDDWEEGTTTVSGFDIAEGETKPKLKIKTDSALCPGEYTFTLTLEGTVETGEEYTTGNYYVGGTTYIPPTPTTPTTDTGKVTATPGEGGITTLTNPGGSKIELNIPSGAVSEDTNFTIDGVDISSVAHLNPESRLSLVGDLVNEIKAKKDDEFITTFDKPLTLTFTYTDEKIEGIKENSLKIYSWNKTQNEWIALENSKVDIDNNTITASVDHFTIFALLGSKIGFTKEREQETEENISEEEEEKEEEGIISSEETGESKKESGEEKEETKEKPKNEGEAPKTQPEVKGITKPAPQKEPAPQKTAAPPKEPAPQKLSNETPENKTGLMANLAMASGEITQSPFLTFVVILCLVSLVAVGVRKWWLFQKKRKK